MTALAEWYESGNAPHEALGRAARRLMGGGALYLGGGVGIEKLQGKDGAASYSLTKASGGKAEAFTGPLSAVMRGFAVAGSATGPDTPGGVQKVSDPAAAARLRELADSEREARQQIERYERRLARKASAPAQTLWRPGIADDDAWEQRRIEELKVELSQISRERAQLLSSGKVEEAEAGKPGTNWKQVTPEHRKKIGPIVRHYMGKAHPFAACVRDNRKRFGDRAEQVCAVVKDMGEKRTTWRKGGGGKRLREATEELRVLRAVAEAVERVDVIDSALGAGAAVELAQRAGGIGNAQLDALGEQAFADLGALFVAGHPLGVVWQDVREAAVA